MSMTQHKIQSWTPQFEFSDRIRKIRRDLGVSQESFAADLGIKKVTLGAWEVGRSEPRDVVAVAKRIELLTRVPAAWTLGLYEESRRPAVLDGGSSGVVHPPGLEPGTRS